MEPRHMQDIATLKQLKFNGTEMGNFIPQEESGDIITSPQQQILANSKCEDTIPTIKTILSDTREVTNWYSFGIQLGIKPEDLDQIGSNYSGDTARCKTEVVNFWLRNTQECTWDRLAQAVDGMGGHTNLVQTLRKNHQQSIPQVVKPLVHNTYKASRDTQGKSFDGESLTQQSRSSHREQSKWAKNKSSLTEGSSGYGSASPSTVDSESEDASSSLATPVGCGCGKCSLYTLCTKGCSQPSGGTPLPIWNGTESTFSANSWQYSYESKLIDDTKEMSCKFASLVNRTVDSLKTVSLNRITLWMKHLEAIKPVTVTKALPLLVERMEEVGKAENVEQLFWILSDYWSWYNKYLLEKLIAEFGDREDKDRLREYDKAFTAFLGKRLPKSQDHFSFGAGHGKDRKPLLIKVDEIWEAISLGQIRGLHHSIAEILGVPPHLLYLSSVSKGCICLDFMVPSFLPDHLFPLSASQEKALLAASAFRLECGEYVWQAPSCSETPGSKANVSGEADLDKGYDGSSESEGQSDSDHPRHVGSNTLKKRKTQGRRANGTSKLHYTNGRNLCNIILGVEFAAYICLLVLIPSGNQGLARNGTIATLNESSWLVTLNTTPPYPTAAKHNLGILRVACLMAMIINTLLEVVCLVLSQFRYRRSRHNVETPPLLKGHMKNHWLLSIIPRVVLTVFICLLVLIASGKKLGLARNGTIATLNESSWLVTLNTTPPYPTAAKHNLGIPCVACLMAMIINTLLEVFCLVLSRFRYRQSRHNVETPPLLKGHMKNHRLLSIIPRVVLPVFICQLVLQLGLAGNLTTGNTTLNEDHLSVTTPPYSTMAAYYSQSATDTCHANSTTPVLLLIQTPERFPLTIINILHSNHGGAIMVAPFPMNPSDQPPSFLLTVVSCLMHQRNCQIPNCPCKSVQERYQELHYQHPSYHPHQHAAETCKRECGPNADPGERKHQLHLTLSSQNITFYTHRHYQLTTTSHIRHVMPRPPLKRQHSRSCDLTPSHESPPKFSPVAAAPADGPEVDGFYSDPTYEDYKPPLLREISLSADNIPALCLNACPIPPTPSKEFLALDSAPPLGEVSLSADNIPALCLNDCPLTPTPLKEFRTLTSSPMLLRRQWSMPKTPLKTVQASTESSETDNSNTSSKSGSHEHIATGELHSEQTGQKQMYSPIPPNPNGYRNLGESGCDSTVKNAPPIPRWYNKVTSMGESGYDSYNYNTEIEGHSSIGKSTTTGALAKTAKPHSQ